MSAPDSPDELFDDGVEPAAEDSTSFASTEDDNPETHMSEQEVQ